MSIKIFSNNSVLNAEEELEIINSRSFNLGNTNYYVDSERVLVCNNPYNHGCTTITLCESLSDLSTYYKVEDRCRDLINNIGDNELQIDTSCVRLLSLHESTDDFTNNIITGNDVDLSITYSNVTYLENTSIEYERSGITKRGPSLIKRKLDKNNPFRALVHSGNDFRNVPYTKAPYSSVVMILSETNHSVGSGVFISPRVILTCRHNFYNDDGSFNNGTYSYVQGSNSASNLPDVTSGTKTQINVSNIRTFNQPYEPVSKTDLVVVITDTPCELTYSGATHTDLLTEIIDKNNIDISIIGYPYPNDVPEVKNSMSHGYLYESSGKVERSEDGMLLYKIDTLGGNSGSGVFHNNKVVGVHVGSLTNNRNTAVDVNNQEKLDWLNSIINENKTDGWYEYDGKKYYYEENNIVKGTTKSINGKKYTFDENGVVTSEEDETSNNSSSSNDSNGSGKKSSTTVGNNGTHLWRYNDFAMWNGDTRQGSTNSSVKDDLNGSGNSSSNGNNSNPSNTGQLAGKLKDAVASALDSSNWNAVTDGGNPGIDVDNFPPGAEAQCFDLANYYLMQLGIGWSRTNVDAWGAFNFPLQYKSQFESLGWKLIEYPTLSQLVPGAITFENNQGVALGEVDYGGHTEIITSIEGTSVSFLTQNPNSPTIVTVDGGGEPLGYGYRIQLIAVPPGS